MECLKCGQKMRCFESYKLTQTFRKRGYACLRCGLVYISHEELEPQATDRQPPKRLWK